MNYTMRLKIYSNEILKRVCLFFLFSLIFFVTCNNDKDKEAKSEDTWDIDKNGIPKFVKTDYIQLEKIYRISKFRSSVGHDYSDAFEDCRSMKHYFEPYGDLDWSTIKIYSPVTGKITRVEQEWAGTKIEIESEEHPAFRFSIFHINTPVSYNIDDQVSAGEELGTHIGIQTMSDIAVMVNDPTKQGRMISYFEVLTDAVFIGYSERGVSTREMLIISKEVRDSNPLFCNGDMFVSSDSLESWIILQ